MGFDRRWIAARVGSVVVNRDDSGENTCHVAVATMGRLAGLYSLPSTVAVVLWRSVEALPMVPTAADPAAMVPERRKEKPYHLFFSVEISFVIVREVSLTKFHYVSAPCP